MTKMTPKRQAFLDAVRAKFGDVKTVTRKEVVELVEAGESSGMKWPSWLTSNHAYRAERGVFRIPEVASTPAPAEAVEPEAVEPEVVEESKPEAE